MIRPQFLDNGLINIDNLRDLEKEAQEAFDLAKKHLQHVQAVLHSSITYNSKMEAENAVLKHQEDNNET